MTKSFRGVVGGVTYTEPALFEQAAKDLGYHPNGRRSNLWKVGTAVRVTFKDGTKVSGQVWSPSKRCHVWVALDNGTYVEVHTPSRTVYGFGPILGRLPVGKVAA